MVVSSLQCSEYIAFFPFSHWRNLWLRHLAGYSFGLKGKGSVRVSGCFISYYTENIAFFSSFPADGLHDWGILLVTPLEFQEIKHQPFPMAQPREKASTMFYGTGFFIIY